MHLHASAALTVRQRRRLCDLVAGGATITAAAVVVGCSRQTASKWVNRGRRGEPLADRSSRPHRSPRRTPASLETAILRAREQLQEGPHVIGCAVGAAASTPCTRCFPAGQRAGGLTAPLRRDRRPQPTRLRLGLSGSDQRQRDRVPQRARPLLPHPRDRGGASDDRQRHLLQTALERRLQRARDQRQEDPRLPASDQRESREIHPHPARALGLRLHLRERARQTRRTRTRTRLLQSLPSPPRPRFRPHRAVKGQTPFQRVNNLPGTYT